MRATKADKQAEALKATSAARDRIYAKNPALKADVAKAAGYAVFTTYGVSFIIGGSGGTGVVHDNKTNKNTFMKIGGASAGFQLGAVENDVLVIFKSAAAMQGFVKNGWGATGGAPPEQPSTARARWWRAGRNADGRGADLHADQERSRSRPFDWRRQGLEGR